VSEVPDFRIRHPQGADALLGYFREAESRFAVDWEVLAAIMLVETRMGRIRSRSSAGAQGPMQFLPSTWEAYGLGGDIHDPRDAVLGAANYLRASGAPDDYTSALHAYNPVDAYVTAVWRYAKTMMRFPDSYYAYYNWQVFVRTVDGDVRLSGPGL
jgi:membrane-bound lytic murein transglycosylase B